MVPVSARDSIYFEAQILYLHLNLFFLKKQIIFIFDKNQL